MEQVQHRIFEQCVISCLFYPFIYPFNPPTVQIPSKLNLPSNYQL